MEALHTNCCGIDGHKRQWWHASSPPTQRASKEVRTYATLTDELLALGDWLADQVTQVAMESTGGVLAPVVEPA